MGFSGSGGLAICIAMFPNKIDDWDISSPFPEVVLNSKDALVLSNAIEVGSQTKVEPVPSRLMTVGQLSNEVNFIAKTFIDTKSTAESKGIGGLSKLKDFNFSISLSNVRTNDSWVNKISTQSINNLYGRKVLVYITDTGLIEDYDSSHSTPLYTGVISSANRSIDSVTFTVGSLLDVNGPTVKGEVVTDSEGNIVTDTLVVGNTEDALIKLNKIKDSSTGLLSVSFTQSDKYKIMELYVKQTNDANEEFFYPIQTAYDLVDGEIIFKSDRKATAVYRAGITDPYLSPDTPKEYQWSRLIVENYGIFGVQFDNEAPDLVIGKTYKTNSIIGAPLKSSSVIYLGRSALETETGVSLDFYLFKGGYDMCLGASAHAIGIDTKRVYIEDENGDEALILTNSHVLLEEPPIRKQLDATKFGDMFNVLDGTEFYNTFINRYSPYSFQSDRYRQFQRIDEEPLKIQIGNEVMLVCYTEVNFNEPIEETVIFQPELSYIYVRRAIDNTPFETHTDGDEIIVLKGEDQKIKYLANLHLKGVKSMEPSFHWRFKNMHRWIGETEELKVSPWIPKSNAQITPCPYLCLNWNIPNLSGDLKGLELSGSATVVPPPFDTEYPYTSAKPSKSFISIGFDPMDSYDLSYEKRGSTRRFIGRRVGIPSVFENPSQIWHYTLAYEQDKAYGFSLEAPSRRGLFRLDLLKRIGDLGFSLGEYISPGGVDSYQEELVRIYPCADFSEIESYPFVSNISDLREMSMYLIFTNDQKINKSSSFRVSPLNLEALMEVNLNDVEIYAKVVNKKLLDDPIDEITVGSNCKIMLDGQSPRKDFHSVIISDDDLIGFQWFPLKINGTFVRTNRDDDHVRLGKGFLTKRNPPDLTGTTANFSDDLIRFIVSKEFSKSEFLGRDNVRYQFGYNPLDQDDSVFVGDLADPYTLDEGRLVLDVGSYYVVVVQEENKVKVISKGSNLFSNPVEVIRNLILNYGDGLEIDETSFDASSLARRDWKCRMVISEEKPLKTVIDTIAQEHGLIVFEDVLGKMTCLTLDPPVESEILSGGKDISGSLTAMRSSKADFKEKFTDIEYLISELDTHYNKFDQDNYKGYIKSDDLGYQDALDKAKEFLNGNKVKVNLKLETVIDSVTASNIAILKTNYHFMPTRIITVGCIFDTSAWNLGMWVTCSSEVIGETTGKVYFIIRKGVIVPFGKNRAGVSLTLLEYDADAIRLQIREVPRQSVNTNYDEVIDSDEQIEEVPDAE